MTFGIGALNCRLDSDVPATEPGGVDWDDFLDWTDGVRPAFAGKYFIGSPWRWVHGEATSLIDPAVPGASLKIAPLQAADGIREAEPGELGTRWGAEDGKAIASAIAQAHRVGDLLAPPDSPVYVYLEVVEPTNLTSEYWGAWAAAVANAVMPELPSSPHLTVLKQPLLPCLAVGFVPSADHPGHWEVPEEIRTILDAAGAQPWTAGRCYGIWASTTDPEKGKFVAMPALDWTTFVSYSQPQMFGPAAEVPVRIWRYTTGDPSDPIREVGKITLEATSAPAGQPDSTLAGMLTAKAWRPADPSIRPSAIGVDRGDSLVIEIKCLSTKELVVSHLPEISPSKVEGPAIDPPLKAPATFAVRYYSAGLRNKDGKLKKPSHNEKDLHLDEAKFLSSIVDIVSVFQARVEEDLIPAYLREFGHGLDDGFAAAQYAATVIGQPPHTPIYFAVDCDANPKGVSTKKGPGGEPIEAVTDEELIGYFEDVASGVESYLKTQPKAIRRPYAIGAYACAHAFNVLYPRGLISHFWQNYPPFWGDSPGGPKNTNLAAWPHDNFWQVGMAYVPSVEVSTRVEDCHKTMELRFNDLPGPAFVSFTVELDGEPPVTTAVPFPPDLKNLEPWKIAAKASGVFVKRFEEHFTTLRFAYPKLPKKDIKAAMVDTAGKAEKFEITFFQTDQLADVNVAWGNAGGWRLPRGGR